MGEDDKKVDYLEVDDGIPGQNYVCLSFISPESIIASLSQSTSASSI